MSRVSVAVGCAVGIPIAVGVFIASFFWWRLQRRFRKEEEMDQELERAVYDETGFISFDNLASLQQNDPKSNTNTVTNDISTDQNEGSDNSDTAQPRNTRKSKYFVPAYRRKINSMSIPNPSVAAQQHTSTSPHNTNKFTSIQDSSTASFDSSFPTNQRKISVYDQMIPIMSGINDSKGKLNSGTTMGTGSTIIAPDDSHSFQFHESTSSDDFIRNLHNQDFGSYYPKRASTSNISKLNGLNSPIVHNLNQSNNSFHTRDNSSLTTTQSKSNLNLTLPEKPIENVFDTPKSQRQREERQINQHIDIDDSVTSSLRKDDNSSSGNNNYSLKNNYDFANDNNVIEEEDQYENEFTNYAENKRAFIDSLKPK
ncbi:Skg1p NDAI_0E05100 [Naumovozyma dairenensis CBS 421]|uniref:Suppressor of lethality of KEX2 GAS1 double null mutant protein 1 n=1 Tax=Naumovozyma dairenensis (strain ATCC 10597 / BCRC 20456 / CBS 421 / NBRC 0211 / NRRL Y-12639) TaxID=1071378 RepID=G0WAQ4_NAUDC|nr:hypothetical protein NDAI_0E05100 [Naumovozyma dairenensis CBS 421]CCD25327.1 hypothetical protein NDAI_0E05100 [Naumovozyma dairenensis CBS 421]